MIPKAIRTIPGHLLSDFNKNIIPRTINKMLNIHILIAQ